MLGHAPCHMPLLGNAMPGMLAIMTYRVKVASKVNQVVKRKMADVGLASIRGVCSLEVAIAVLRVQRGGPIEVEVDNTVAIGQGTLGLSIMIPAGCSNSGPDSV